MRSFRFSEVNKTYLFLLFILLLVLISLISDTFIYSENLYYEYFKDRLTYDQVTEILQFKSDWFFLDYIIIPIVYLLKFFILSMWLLTGIILFGYKASFRRVFHACILAEFVLIIPSIIGLIWFGLVVKDYTISDVQEFHPLSVLSLFEANDLESWIIYPLQSLSLFQLGYSLALAYGIKYAIDKPYGQSLSLTLPVYASGIFIWLIFITFLSISYMP